jgi:HlyD family secretion protein
LELTRKQFLRDSSLYQNGVIALAEYEKSEQTFLQVKNAHQSLLASVANNNMQMNQLTYQIVDLESQQMEQIQTKINALKESYDNLKAVIADWEKTFVLISPVEGKITFNRFWSKNQFVTSGETVYTIVPSLPQRIIGRAKIPVAGSGKLKTGQHVLVRLDNFPYMEFGMLEGKLESLSQVPESSQQGVFYTAEIFFPDGLITNYKKTLPFQQELQGSAEIITQNLSLFDRLISPMKSAIKKSI